MYPQPALWILRNAMGCTADEFYDKLQNQKKFLFLKFLNKIFYKIKKKFHPFSTAGCELFSLIVALFFGKRIEAQGYIIIAHKK